MNKELDREGWEFMERGKMIYQDIRKHFQDNNFGNDISLYIKDDLNQIFPYINQLYFRMPQIR